MPEHKKRILESLHPLRAVLYYLLCVICGVGCFTADWPLRANLELMGLMLYVTSFSNGQDLLNKAFKTKSGALQFFQRFRTVIVTFPFEFSKITIQSLASSSLLKWID